MRRKAFFDEGCAVRLHDLLDRDVDMHGDRVIHATFAGESFAGPIDRPATHADDQTGLFREWNEIVGHE